MSGKADTLGAAPAFGAARGARSPRRTAIERTTGGERAATAAITELPVTVISDNPDNPRNHLRNLDYTVDTVREVGILLPIVVATIDAYLRDRPDRAGDLDDGAQYLVVDGHRRLEAARRVGLATIPVRVDNARVATDETLLEAAFIANYQREDMTDLEEAHALEQLVEHYGSQSKAAKRLGMSQATISSKLSLLKLTPQLQKDLVDGTRTVEHVRNLGKLSPQEQQAKADERAQAARAKAERTAQAIPAPAPVVERSSGPADYHAVIITDPERNADAASPAVPAAAPPTAAAVPAPVAPRSGEVLPEPRDGESVSDAVARAKGKPFPYDDGLLAAQLLIHNMDAESLDAAYDVLTAHRSRIAAAD